jgi:hypothetical protein
VLSHELFEVPVAEAEAAVQPDAVSDDLCWEPVALAEIGCGWRVHRARMPHDATAGKARSPIESVKNEIDMVGCPFLHILPRRESIWLLAKTVMTLIP